MMLHHHQRTPMDTMGQFQADVGYVFPAITHHFPTKYVTKPLFAVSAETQAVARSKLREAFGYSEDSILPVQDDALYVCCDAAGAFVGCVAIDRRLVWPYVSHLLVDRASRNRGFGSMLMLQVAEPSVTDMGFAESRLWCEPALVPFYERIGYEIDEAPPDVVDQQKAAVVFMRKSLVAASSSEGALESAYDRVGAFLEVEG